LSVAKVRVYRIAAIPVVGHGGTDGQVNEERWNEAKQAVALGDQ